MNFNSDFTLLYYFPAKTLKTQRSCCGVAIAVTAKFQIIKLQIKLIKYSEKL
ncbi:MAG: hypothetical protein F6K08_24165 [Okeania sp. SIO1H6]|nr:hypothetical protein [Okeania sp. SIO1H6]